jgi:hypothetical protein
MASQDSQPLAAQERRALRIVVAVVALVGTTIVGAIFLFFLARDIANAEPWMMELFRNHAAAVLGLPTGALAALCIVLFLEAKSGRIEFEGFGFKFRGASGEIILWVICFLAIVTAIKLLW